MLPKWSKKMLPFFYFVIPAGKQQGVLKGCLSAEGDNPRRDDCQAEGCYVSARHLRQTKPIK